METKICSKCGERKALDCFVKDKSRKDGIRGFCTQCRKLKDVEYRRINKEKLFRYNKAYADKNKEYLKIYHKSYREKKGEELLAQKREYHLKMKTDPVYLEKRKLYAENNSTKLKQQRKRFRENNRQRLSVVAKRKYQRTRSHILEKSRIKSLSLHEDYVAYTLRQSIMKDFSSAEIKTNTNLINLKRKQIQLKRIKRQILTTE